MTQPPLKKLTIIQHNVRNWSTNKITLSNIYNKIDPDIILINEHSLLNDTIPKIFNYNSFTTNKNNEHYAGAAIAIRRGIEFKLHDNFYSDTIAVTIQTMQGPITIATSYVPPRTNYINLIDFNTILSNRHPAYIIGDLNAKHHSLGHQSTNIRGQNLNSLIQQNKCTHIGPFFPTYIGHNSTTTPDIALSNQYTFHNAHFTPGPPTPSDHIPIIITISANPIQIPIKPRMHFHKANWTEFKESLKHINPPPITNSYSLNEIDQHITDWTNAITNASNKSIPTLTHRIIPGIKPNHQTLLIQTQYQHQLQDIINNGPNLQKYRILNALRSQLNIQYRSQYIQNWNNIINKINIEPDPKSFWRSIKRMTNTNNKQKIPYIKHNNQQLNTPSEKEHIFRNHWSEIYSGTDPPNNHFNHAHIQEIEENVQQNAPLITTHNHSDITRLNFHFPPITMEELKRALATTKQKAPGPTNITALQIKNLPINMKQYLLNISNHALSAGYFPTPFKQAIVIFIPKPNTSQLNVKNYRPISLIDVQSKLIDKILNYRLTNSLIINNKLNIRQHGFRNFRGTHTALLTLHEKIATSLAQQHKIDIVLRDVSKAFDKVWHTGLTYKIIQLNLHPCFTKTIVNYYTDRKAKIRINNYIGPSFNLHSGVPQGACLSPTLYNFYTHDCPPPIAHSDYIAFADDITQIITLPGSPNMIALNTKRAIEQINHYENNWKIQTNTSKFNLIAISRLKTGQVTINQTPIPYNRSGKILGLNITRTGITSQITTRTAIARNNLDKLYRFIHLSANNKRKLYIALVRSALTYPIIPTHTASKTAISKLQKIQNRATRFITNTHWTDFRSSEFLHLTSRLPPINSFLYQSALDLWNKIEITDPDLYNQLTFPDELVPHQHRSFQSSFIKKSEPQPEPKYL